MEFDTISAISTPMGEGAIAIVRLSGDQAIEITDKLFVGVSGKKLENVSSHTIHYGKIIDPTTDEVVEEVMVSVMKAPKTFTRENIIEINCHGGLVSVNRVLQLVLRYGARLAEPGEFTKRAFLNGRIDLSQAEAVMDLIRAKTDRAMNIALGQMEGRLSKLIQKLRQEILEVVAHVEVNIDYPEYDDVEEMSHRMLKEKANYVRDELKKLLQTAGQGKILREGLSTAIIGRPNVGKSSLLNSLVQENKAIVTDIPGTTRDVIEEYVNVRGVPLRLVDTAGIRETEDIVEKIGVERSRKVLKEADLILLVLNYADDLTKEDEQLFEAVKGMDVIVIINKTDLPQKIDMDKVKELSNEHKVITTSLLEEKGVDDLEEAISSMYFQGSIEASDLTYISNSRHIALIGQALDAIEDVLSGIEFGTPIDIIQIDLTRTWELLGEIIGDTVQESLINQLFSQFCLGK
ncbi:tRNA uridine-5-carboxymethylaminomethyl(34) synthesis GTPase MnmE [Heyndrickxia oleronia]|jgi:tRNA modification GTPase|uniref:tRNA uridine-5-carboxymethylaminomethyl(34) synthesis GTPase MnmE n=1 Tax=Heyndrickxia oleronia TaxID=38875 RepID=UPI00217D0169|nr:tRNA uridine-5-carboxymethylaminomethyl(34) synthesis GTPase MnmE [Heyndrickxia oleronia]MCI1592839.1 tRNA uridine-5-carboxymethylaminomethyl(34) synthesis GTPase MnmE [Heyndrickxia oleronia]MCI1615643.1 tRNA uridine-5-carboxymethylaminomethyl(34) synthesis GTPase MnmE [Heyndrickxia oleronia]MCI1744270.1 tRNA uridine-5-carboxymethylaminomethyl(34) synthesis GTPase MnmE [Heyndrickxia oleronia]MCI1763964.1 tRNA uridine-5-carboxymethylaminomethyl(34) synthesis GTPase MnmE [Heyndrickxia oleronia